MMKTIKELMQDKKTITDLCYCINNKINFNKLDQKNQEAFKQIEKRFWYLFDKKYKLSFREFNTLVFNIGNYLDDGLHYEDIYFKLKTEV